MCWKCGKSFNNIDCISRDSVCQFCGAPIRCCKNCKYYEMGSHYDCHETVDEPVFDKEKPNFCDFFSISNKSSNNVQTEKVEKARDAFNSLFGE